MDISYKGKSGIYKLIHLKRNVFYIGSAVCIYTRLHNHYSQLKKRTHCNNIIQRIYNKYGKDNLSWEVLELCDKSRLIELEQYHIDKLRPELNICKYAQNTLGYKHSEKTKLKLSKMRKGINHCKGRKHSLETRMKLSKSAKSRGIHKAFTEGAIKANTGRKHSKELRNKIAVIQSKISPKQAVEIRDKRSMGIFQHLLAKEYGVSQRVIFRVEKCIGIYGTKDYFDAGNKRFSEHIKQGVLF